MNLEFIHCSSHKASVATVIVGGKRYCRLCYIRDKLAEVGPALSELGAHNICYDNKPVAVFYPEENRYMPEYPEKDNAGQNVQTAQLQSRADPRGPASSPLSKNVDNLPSRETALEIVRECDKIIAELGVKSDNQ